MTLLPFNSLFDNIETHVAAHMGPQDVYAAQRTRALLHGPDRHSAPAREIWNGVLSEAATQPTDTFSSVLLVWFAIPRLRRTVRRVTSRLPCDRFDLEGASVLGLLEGIHAVNPLAADAGEVLLRRASSRAWRLARGTLPERPVPDPTLVPRTPEPAPPQAIESSWIVHITPPDRPDGLSAPVRFSASKTRIEGERLGVLAVRMNLGDVVERARRPGPGRRIGTLTLHPTGVVHEP
ncbi:hypothetical protein [Streptomyces sp. NPDC058305]|uniref:hypothetical protein n=1 Tax=Streptomyces sp. NPDC058305 TaxID=3346438 RepID=UPI0036EE8CD5